MPILLIAVACNAVPVSMIVPMLPFLGQRYNASEFEVAVLFAIMPLIGIIGNPIWGRFSDSIGKRVALSCTLGGTALSFVAFAFADSLFLLYFTRILQGIFHGSISIALAYVALTSTQQDRAKSMGQIFGSMGIGLAIGPVIGGLLLGQDSSDFSQVLPCLAAASLSVCASFLVFFFLKDIEKEGLLEGGGKKPQNKQLSKTLRTVVATPALWPLVIMIWISGFKMNAEQVSYPYWGISVEWTPKLVSFGFAALSVGFLITSLFLIGPMVKRFGEEKTLAIASMVDVIALVGFLFTSSHPWSWVWLFLISFSSPMWGTVIISVISRHAPEGLQGTVQGLASSTQLAGRIIGTLIAGVILERSGYAGVYLLIVILLTLIVFQAFRFVSKSRDSSESFSG